MVPDEFPQDAAHAHLFLGSQLLTCDDGIIDFLHHVFLKCHLHNLIAQVDEGDARGVVAAVHDHVDSVSELLVVVEEMNGICIVIHSGFVLEYGAKIGIISKLATFWPTDRHFFTPYINMSRRFRIFAGESKDHENRQPNTDIDCYLGPRCSGLLRALGGFAQGD